MTDISKNAELQQSCITAVIGSNGVVNEIFNEDCQDTMMRENVKFKYVITSPPYNLGGDFHTFSKGKRVTHGDYDGFSDNLPEGEYQKQQVSVLNQIFEKIDNDGIVFYNHKVRIKDRSVIHPIEWIKKSKFNIYQIVTINFKSTANVDKSRFFPVSELLFILTKDKKTLIKNEKCFTDIVDIKKGGRKLGHPATFSEEFVNMCLSVLPTNGIVYDPYMGTGTTAYVCEKLGFNYIGSEVSKATHSIAMKRNSYVDIFKNSSTEN